MRRIIYGHLEAIRDFLKGRLYFYDGSKEQGVLRAIVKKRKDEMVLLKLLKEARKDKMIY